VDRLLPSVTWLIPAVILAGAGSPALALPASTTEHTDVGTTVENGDRNSSPDDLALALSRAILSDVLARNPFSEAQFQVGDLPVDDGTAGELSGPDGAPGPYWSVFGLGGEGIRLTVTLDLRAAGTVRNGAATNPAAGDHMHGPAPDLSGVHDTFQNSVGTGVHYEGTDAQYGGQTAPDQRLIVAAINTNFEATFAQAIHEIFDPTADAPGSMRFSMFGRGDFQVMHSSDTPTLSIVDLQSGASVTLIMDRPSVLAAELPEGEPAKKLTVGQFLRKFGEYVLQLLTRPSVMALLATGLAFWLFWWLRRRNAAAPASRN
jgi:hypothetical protein